MSLPLLTINVLCNHDHGLQSTSYMASGKKCSDSSSCYNATIRCIQWMTRSSSRHQCSQSSCCPFQSSVPNQNVRNRRCCRPASLAKLLQAHFPHHFVIVALHLLLTFHCLGRSVWSVHLRLFFAPICNTSKNIEKYEKQKCSNFELICHLGGFKNQRLLSWLKCPASRACASNAAFLERQLHATKTACPTTSCFHCSRFATFPFSTGPTAVWLITETCMSRLGKGRVPIKFLFNQKHVQSGFGMGATLKLSRSCASALRTLVLDLP